MRSSKIMLRSTLGSALWAMFAAGLATGASAVQSCPPPAPARAAARAGDTIVINEAAQPPCRFAAELRAELRASPSGAYPDPYWTSVIRDSRGRFYTAARGNADRVLLWNADGSFQASFGRAGQGPGELSGAPALYIGPGDSVFAVQGGGRTSVFAAGGVFARTFTMSGVRGQRHTMHVVDDGRIISAGASRAPGRSGRVQVFDASGSLQRSIGTPVGTTQMSEGGGEHPLAYGGGTTFWTALPSPQRDGYYLEHWSLDGELRSVIRRTASWAASEPADAAIFPGGLPYIRGLWLDPDGNLWITLLVRDRRAGTLDRRQMSDSTMSRFFDLRHEVVDPRTGVLLASAVFDEVVEGGPDVPPIVLTIPRSRMSWTEASDPVSGLPSIRISELRLVPR